MMMLGEVSCLKVNCGCACCMRQSSFWCCHCLEVFAACANSEFRNLQCLASALLLQVMMRLVSGGYQVVTQQYLFPTHTMSREEAACVEYYIALESSKFVGNSVSSFAAVLILERQKVGRWATYYNGGNIPMSAALPLYKLPWVFTYNSWSSSYDYMLKAAVRSGLEAETFVPYCLFSGDKAAPVAKWLQVSSQSFLPVPIPHSVNMPHFQFACTQSVGCCCVCCCKIYPTLQWTPTGTSGSSHQIKA